MFKNEIQRIKKMDRTENLFSSTFGNIHKTQIIIDKIIVLI